MYKTRELKGEKTVRFTTKALPCGSDTADKLKQVGPYRSTDYTMAIVTLTLSELVKETPNANSMQVCVPFSLRGFPESVATLECNNDFACVPFWIHFPKDAATGERIFLYKDKTLDKKQLKESMTNVMARLRTSMREKRSKFLSIGWYYMMKYFLFLLRYALNYQP